MKSFSTALQMNGWHMSGLSNTLQGCCLDDSIKADPYSFSTVKSELLKIQKTLGLASGSVERRFVDIGERLQAVFAVAQKLSYEVSAAARLMGSEGEEPDGLHEAEVLACLGLAAIQQDEVKIAGRLQGVSRIADELSALYPLSRDLVKISKQLRVTSIYFAVEGSRNSNLAGTFAVFTEELGNLADTVCELASSIGMDSRASSVKERSAESFIHEEARRLGQLASSAETAVGSAADDANRVVEISVNALDKIAGHSQKIARAVSDIVVAIQVDDITRQQIEHVLAAIQDLDAQQCPTDSPDSNKTLARFCSALSIQAAQLRPVIGSIHNAHSSINASLRVVSEESGLITEEMAAMNFRTRRKDASGDLLAGIKLALTDLCRLIEHAELLSVQACDSARDASDATMLLTKYVKHVRKINSELEIKALNATVKSAGLGDDGRAVTVLAQEVVRLSQNCNGLVERMASAIEAVTEQVVDSENSCSVDQETSESAADQLRAGIERICARYEEFLEKSSGSVSGVAHLQDMLADIESKLGFLEELEDMLELCHGSLCGIVEIVSPYVESSDESETDLNDSDRYTMELERAVHAQALGSNSALSNSLVHLTGENQQPAGQGSSDDLGDNVELF